MQSASEINFTRPQSSKSRLEVRITNPGYFKANARLLTGFFVFILVVFICSILFPIQHDPYKMSIIFLGVPLFGLMAVVSRKKAALAKAKPIVMEAFDDGLWFTW